MELSSNFTWGLIDESDFDHSSLIEHHGDYLEANDISFDVSKYVSKSKRQEDANNPQGVLEHDNEGRDTVSTPTLSLPDSFDETENIKNINISPVRKQKLDGMGKDTGSMPSGKANAGGFYQPIIRHLKQALRKLVISEKAFELLKVKAVTTNNELSLYEEACLRVMEFALPFKQDLEALRLNHQEVLQVVKNLTQQSELAVIERERQDKLHQCTIDAMQLEINTHLEANRRLQEQLARETVQCAELAKTAQKTEYDADILRHQLAEQNQVLLQAKLEYQAVVDDKVDKELGRLKDSTNKEIEHMKLIATDVMERENRLHKEYNLGLQTEYAALKTQHAALQQQLAELSASHYAECKVLNTECSDLKAQLKMSLYENTILSASADAKNSGYQQCKIELEGQMEENRAMRATLAQLEVQYHTNISELQTTNRYHSQQLQQYADLESCLDVGIMNVAKSGVDPSGFTRSPEMDSLNHLVSSMTMGGESTTTATGGSAAAAAAGAGAGVMSMGVTTESGGQYQFSHTRTMGGAGSGQQQGVVSVAAYQKRLTYSIQLAQDCLKHQSKCSTLKLDNEALVIENTALKKKCSELVADYRRCNDLPSFQIVNSLRGYESKYNAARTELSKLKALYEQLVRTHEETDSQNQVLQRVQEQNKVELEQIRQALLEMEIAQRLNQQQLEQQSRRRYDSDSNSDSCSESDLGSSSDYSSGADRRDRRRSRHRSSIARSSGRGGSSGGGARSNSSSVRSTGNSGGGSNQSRLSSHSGTPVLAHLSPPSAEGQEQSPPTGTVLKQQQSMTRPPVSTPARLSPPTSSPSTTASPVPAIVSGAGVATPVVNVPEAVSLSKPTSPMLTPEKLGLSAAQFQALTSSRKSSPDSKWHLREKT